MVDIKIPYIQEYLRFFSMVKSTIDVEHTVDGRHDGILQSDNGHRCGKSLNANMKDGQVLKFKKVDSRLYMFLPNVKIP